MQSPRPKAGNYSKLTMAQVLAGSSSFSGGSEVSAVNAAKEKKKYTWRALETSKQIVTKPGARGTRTSELHLRIPRCPATADLYNVSGSRLINAVIAIVNKNANSDEIQAYKANPSPPLNGQRDPTSCSNAHSHWEKCSFFFVF